MKRYHVFALVPAFGAFMPSSQPPFFHSEDDAADWAVESPVLMLDSDIVWVGRGQL